MSDAIAHELFEHFRKDPMVELSSVERQELNKPGDFTGMQFTEDSPANFWPKISTFGKSFSTLA